MSKYCFIFLVTLVSSCHEAPKSLNKALQSPEPNVIQANHVKSVGSLNCSIVYYRDNVLFAKFNDTINSFIPILYKQKALYALSDVKFDIELVDSIICLIKMPNREKGNIEFAFTFDQYYKEQLKFNHNSMLEINHFLLIENIERGDDLLNFLNLEFAKIFYGKHMSEEAINGMDAIQTIYSYIEDRKNNEPAISELIIQQYISDVNSNKYSNKKMHQELISKIEKQVEN